MKPESLLPALSIVLALLGWEGLVRLAGIPHYTLPAPSLILQTLWANLDNLLPAWWFTLRLTLSALALAAFGGGLARIGRRLFLGAPDAAVPRLLQAPAIGGGAHQPHKFNRSAHGGNTNARGQVSPSLFTDGVMLPSQRQ